MNSKSFLVKSKTLAKIVIEMTAVNTIAKAIAITFAITLTACSSLPARNSALDQATGRVNLAALDTTMIRLAPEEWARTNDSLRAAEKSWNSGADPATVDHLAYLTGQRLAIAQEAAAGRASQAITASAATERDKMLLTMRTSEADAAQKQVAVAQQSNAQKTAELAVADATLKQDKAQMALSAARVSDLESQLQDLRAKKTDRGMVITLGDTLFESGQSDLQSDGTQNLIKLADFLKRNPKQQVSIDGFTDSVGATAANYDLSERRANAVLTALVRMGVTADRLSARGHGKDEPVASNRTAAGRQMNRRVEVLLGPQPGVAGG